MLSATKQLVDLQQVDVKISEVVAHTGRLSAHKRHLEARIAQERAHVTALRDALQKAELDSRARNLEVDELDMRIRAYQERLDKGIISFKEMEDLRTKIATEKVRMSRLEDEALEAMNAIETARVELSAAQVAIVPLEGHLREQVEATAREIEATESGTLADLRRQRALLAAAAEPYALAQYEGLRAALPNPVVTIAQGTCGGCRIRVSANTVERVRAGRELVTCEHCSRILFVQ